MEKFVQDVYNKLKLEWCYLRFSVPIFSSGVEPMSVGVNMELLKVSEFIERMMLEIVHL